MKDESLVIKNESWEEGLGLDAIEEKPVTITFILHPSSFILPSVATALGYVIEPPSSQKVSELRSRFLRIRSIECGIA